MNKEIDWHGMPHFRAMPTFSRPFFKYEGGKSYGWRNGEWVEQAYGAYPKPAACPVGWDERDALV